MQYAVLSVDSQTNSDNTFFKKQPVTDGGADVDIDTTSDPHLTSLDISHLLFSHPVISHNYVAKPPSSQVSFSPSYLRRYPRESTVLCAEHGLPVFAIFILQFVVRSCGERSP